jgi:heme-degrading monooxygenase HmoA
MFAVVGRFTFQPVRQEERQRMTEEWDRGFSPLAKASPGFRGVQFVKLSDDEMMTVWQWENEADWDAAQARFGPYLQQHVAPHLSDPPERTSGPVVMEVAL